VNEELSYERAVELFDAKLAALEDGSLTLEQALQAVEEASTYLRAANQRLEEARRRIEVRPPEAPEMDEPAPRPANGSAPVEDDLPF
jgi:exodeoxyribonuclease VII small subunit